jgi:hypothetical protein
MGFEVLDHGFRTLDPAGRSRFGAPLYDAPVRPRRDEPTATQRRASSS